MHQPCDGVFPFILQLYQLYKWTDDTEAVTALWPAAVRAFEWEMEVGLGGTPLPRLQCMAYDIIDIFKFDHVAYNAILYQAALRALIEMASDAASPSTFNASLVSRAKAAAEAGLVELNRTMWAAPARGGVTDDSTSEDDNNNGTSSSSNGNNDSNSDGDGYFRAWYDAQAGSPPWLQADTMYGEMWGCVLGLGGLLPREQVAQHLRSELRRNDGPYGLTVLTVNGTTPVVPTELNRLYTRPAEPPDCGAAAAAAQQNSVCFAISCGCSIVFHSLRWCGVVCFLFVQACFFSATHIIVRAMIISSHSRSAPLPWFDHAGVDGCIA